MIKVFSMSERFESQVKGLTFKGLGVVSHPNGQVFFVRGVWPGDEGIFEIQTVEKRYGYARVIDFTKKSEHRRSSPCPHLGFELSQCGGCPWMIADYSAQLEEKNKLVQNLLVRASVLTDKTTIKPIIGSIKEFGYRNRAQFKTDGKVLGYVSTQTNEIAPIEDCIVLTEKNREKLKEITSHLPNKDWEIKKTKDIWNFIEIDEDTKDIVINKKTSFRQANSTQNTNMKAWLEGKLRELDKNQSVVELFCGSGNFTEVISEVGFSQIIASEMSSQAIEVLKNKNLPNVIATSDDLNNPRAIKNLKNKLPDPKILFLDPPREGFPNIGEFIKEFKSIEHIFYVSCDLSTYIHDVKKLRGQKYEIVEIQPIDQFPQTPHIEILSHLTKI